MHLPNNFVKTHIQDSISPRIIKKEVHQISFACQRIKSTNDILPFFQKRSSVDEKLQKSYYIIHPQKSNLIEEIKSIITRDKQQQDKVEVLIGQLTQLCKVQTENTKKQAELKSFLERCVVEKDKKKLPFQLTYRSNSIDIKNALKSSNSARKKDQQLAIKSQRVAIEPKNKFIKIGNLEKLLETSKYSL